MLRTRIILALSIIAVFMTPTLQAQEKTGNVILDAMSDELDRSMSELRLPPFEKPFFMMYGVIDQKQYSVSASLAAITDYNERHSRFRSSSRILVGNYEFNDESLDDDLFSPPTQMDIQLPLDDDYFGIRRSFWSITDNVYRNASRHFQKHQQTLQSSGKDLKDIPHRSFAKAEPVLMILDGKSYAWDRSYWESFAKEISALFVDHPTISNSGVHISFTEGHRYMVNSEGTKTRIPFSFATFRCVGQLNTPSGDLGFDHVSRSFLSPDGFKDKQAMISEVKAMIERLESQTSIPKMDEEYTGPVLITGSAVAEAFFGMLMRGPENIMIGDNIQKLTGYQYNTGAQFDSKVGKSVTHEALTIKARPKLKGFKGVEFLSSFPIDDEGVVPQDEEVIIERGVLRSLLNNRTLTGPSQQANGFSNGPGVIEVSAALNDSEKTLKEKLISKAKSQGLDFAIVIRQEPMMGMGFMTVTKVYVSDGREEIIRHAFIQPLTLKALRKMSGATSAQSAYNVGGGGLGGNANGGGTIGFIVPDQILLDEVEVQPMRLPSLKNDDVVSNPLKPGH